MKPSLLYFAFAFVATQLSISYADIIVDFGTGSSFYNAPYSEDGLTMTVLPNSANWTIGPWNSLPNNNSIRTGTNGFTGLRISSTIGPIDVYSFDVRGVNSFQATWQAQSSSNATINIPNGSTTNTVTLPSSGWRGITHFDIFVTGVNSSLTLDNIRFDLTSVPEPSSLMLIVIGGVAIRCYRSRLERGSSRKVLATRTPIPLGPNRMRRI
jgi:hypothetical protein